MDGLLPGFDIMQYLQSLSPQELEAMFFPYQQQQSVYDQQMQMAQQTRQPGPTHSSPVGAAVGGLSDAIGNIYGAYQQKKALEGQEALGTRQQQDASGRIRALLERLRQQQGGGAAPAPSLGLDTNWA